MTAPAPPVVALEIGGSHASCALVDPNQMHPVTGSLVSIQLRPDAGADELLDSLAVLCGQVSSGASHPVAVAIPGPFDYPNGVALFRDVGKFASLYGVDLGTELHARMTPAPKALTFVNDADAFTLGEWINGAAAGTDRTLGVTLGSGVGSCFLDRGRPVHSGPEVPPEGYVHRLTIDGKPLEEVVSRRALVAAFPQADGEREPPLDVRDICHLARAGHATARTVLDRAFHALGHALGPWVARFGATVVVVGGSMTGSWDLIGPPLRAGVDTTSSDVGLLCSPDHVSSALIGAVHSAGYPGPSRPEPAGAPVFGTGAPVRDTKIAPGHRC